MEDATLCETADAAPASLGAASGSGAKIDQSHTCQSSEKRTRDEGAKPAPTFAQIKRARRAQSRAGGPGQCRGPAPRAWPRREADRASTQPLLRASYPLPCFGRSHTIRARIHHPRNGGDLVTEVDGVQLYLSKQSATGVRGLESYPQPSNHTPTFYPPSSPA